MKEDVLEQLVDDYLMHKGYFTRHNVKFKPLTTHSDYRRQDDSVSSDIDVIGVNPKLSGVDCVWVLSCKAWQSGFDPAAKIREMEGNKIVSGREAWKGFRELWEPKWSDAFRQAIEDATGSRSFVYFTVVTALRNPGGTSQWEGHERFISAMGGNPIRVLTLGEILDALWRSLTFTPAASEIGRVMQLIKAAKWSPPAEAARNEIG